MTKDDEMLLNTCKRNFFRDELRRRNTRQGQFDAAMLHLGHPLPGGVRILEPSDNGAGAEAIWGQPSLPLWQRLWVNAYAKLPPRGKVILNALKEDWRSRPAARIAGVDHKTVDRWKTFFKVHFEQCHQAYERDLGE